MYNSIRSAISKTRISGKMSFRAAVEAELELQRMEDEGVRIQSYRLEDGCVVVTVNNSDITL